VTTGCGVVVAVWVVVGWVVVGWVVCVVCASVVLGWSVVCPDVALVGSVVFPDVALVGSVVFPDPVEWLPEESVTFDVEFMWFVASIVCNIIPLISRNMRICVCDDGAVIFFH
jgi:hypothetical protein